MASDTVTGTKSDTETGAKSNNAAQAAETLNESMKKILGKLPGPWKSAFSKFMGPEGGAVKHLGEIKAVRVK